MKKNIIALFIVIILSLEFYIYFSDYYLAINIAGLILIIISTSILSLLLVNRIFKNRKLKVFLSIIIMLFTIIFFVWEMILTSLVSANRIVETWKINQFEIQSVSQTFEGSAPSFYTLTEVFCFGLIKKDIDISFPENFDKVNSKCVLKFVDINMTFDLCNLKQKNAS